MKIKYQISELVDERNRNLFEEVQSKVRIDLVASTEDSWTSKLYDGYAAIGVKKSNYPVASFTHELLHMKYELLGMKCPYFIDNEHIGAELIGYVYNQFAHHKFYNEFINLRFDPKEFLNDFDNQQFYSTLRSDVPKFERIYRDSGNILDAMIVAIPYLMYLSPNQNQSEKPNKIVRLEKISNPVLIEALKNLVTEIQNSTSYDLSIYFAKFFKLCNKPRIGFSLTQEESTIIVAGNI